MQPITKEQESTLFRWSCNVGARPGKKAKAFLWAEKGLTGEQIDLWWDSAIAYVSKADQREQHSGNLGSD